MPAADCLERQSGDEHWISVDCRRMQHPAFIQSIARNPETIKTQQKWIEIFKASLLFWLSPYSAFSSALVLCSASCVDRQAEWQLSMLINETLYKPSVCPQKSDTAGRTACQTPGIISQNSVHRENSNQENITMPRKFEPYTGQGRTENLLNGVQ